MNFARSSLFIFLVPFKDFLFLDYNLLALEINMLNLEKALIFLFTFEHKVLTCLLHFNLLSISMPGNLTQSVAGT